MFDSTSYQMTASLFFQLSAKPSLTTEGTFTHLPRTVFPIGSFSPGTFIGPQILLPKHAGMWPSPEAFLLS